MEAVDDGEEGLHDEGDDGEGAQGALYSHLNGFYMRIKSIGIYCRLLGFICSRV